MTVGSRTLRTCCSRTLKFIRSVRNKLAGSLDVGFRGDQGIFKRILQVGQWWGKLDWNVVG